MTGVPELGPRLRVWSGQSADTFETDDLDLLQPEERTRYTSFRDGIRGTRYAAAHIAVRRHLGELLNCDAGEIRFGRYACPGCGSPHHGRPFIRTPRTSWELSLSRSGPYWLCAVADGMRVGADIEVLRPVNVAQFTGAVLTDGELSYMAGLPAERMQAEFIRCWTRKEAVAKATGIGIEAALSSLDVAPAQPRAVVRHGVAGCPADTWVVQDLPAGPDHFCAVAFPAAYGS
ncbi:4'-phosphopantetheinyl transferase superfamily protein [Streptomyces sp. NPDC029216]|uniref:4'-phosphopantetheinyl transferase family protein n=1 Tax=Streptomyces sp. NPDC029216 TaxID=3154701 RepID=UPI00340A54B3